MRKYAVLSPRFWIGETGRKLRMFPDAQRIALYLISCPDSNMIGIYYISIPTMCHELNIDQEGACKGLIILNKLEFAAYDTISETVFVYEMVRFQVGESLKAGDKRAIGIDNELQLHIKTPFYNDFLEKYKVCFGLKSEAIEDFDKGLARGILQEQEHEHEQEIEHEQNTNIPIPKPKVVHKKILKVSEYSELFLKFWELYPRKECKKDAFGIWNAGDLEKIFDDIMTGLQKTLPVYATKEMNYIPQPTTWLNQRRWEDSPEVSNHNSKEPYGGETRIAGVKL